MWKKVITPTLLVCALWLILSGATTYWIYWLNRSHARILSENVSSIRAAARMQDALWRMQAVVEGAAGAPQADRSRREAEADFAEALAAAGRAVTSAEERVVVDDIHTRFNRYQDVVNGRANDPSAGRPTVAGAEAVLARGIAERCAALLEFNERLMGDAAVRLAQRETALNLARLAFLIAGPALGILVGLKIARGLDRSISQISITLKDASGELDQEVGTLQVSPASDPGDLTLLNRQVQSISTRIRQVLSELQAARQEAFHSERLATVGQLAAGVAHEMRNPLTSVKLLIQMAARKDRAARLEERQTHVVLQEISRMEQTIDELLDYARPPQLHRVRHDVRETLRRALNLIEGRAAQRAVAVSAALGDGVIMVDGDPEQLHQVFINILLNGIESMPDGGVLEVSAQITAGNAGVCLIRVADEGCGIAPDTLPRLFDPFLTTKERGTGLGLAISRRIVRQHGGRITAENRVSRGAVFIVELPLADAAGLVPCAAGSDGHSVPAAPALAED